MEHRDAEVADVVVIIDAKYAGRNQEVVDRLQAMGMQIDSVDDDDGAVEGTVEAAKLRDIEKLEGVEDVRVVFAYIADYPQGDPRDRDPGDGEDLREPK